jgi:cation:H+ antiporter
VVAPLVVSQRLVRLDVPIMIGVSALVLLLAMNGTIGRIEGVLLLAGIGIYTTLVGRAMSRSRAAERAAHPEHAARPRIGWFYDLLLLVGGLAVLVLGSRWLVAGATELARAFGVNDLIIGLTIVAAGTSLPEVATSVTASLRGERDIAVGNIVGSNIFNLLFVLGLASTVAPDGIPVPTAALTFDLPVMLVVAVACLPIFLTGYRVGRREGVIFLVYYVGYTIFLVLDATQHDALPIFTWAMLLFVVPITLITLVVIAVQTRARVTPRE